MAERVQYRNHCQPQEGLNFGVAKAVWYLDSDCGRKLTGNCISKSTSFGAVTEGTLAGNLISLNVKFAYVKNIGKAGDDSFLLNIGGMGTHILLDPGDSFANDIGSTASDSTGLVLTLLDPADRPTYQLLIGT